MKTIITACCPYGNLEKVLLILQQAGLKVENDTFGQWHDQLFGSLGMSNNPLPIGHSLPQGAIPEESIATIISGAENGPLLLADNRCLWLLDFWAAKLPEAKFLLFYTSAESALASACMQGIEPQQALESWQTACRQLLNFLRCHRRQAVLLDMDAAIRQPQAFLDICGRFGLILESLTLEDNPIANQPTVERFLAQHLVANLPDAQSMHAELEASAQPFDEVLLQEMQPLDLFKKQSQQLIQQRKLVQELDETVKKLRIAEHLLTEQELLKEQFRFNIAQLTQANDEQAKLNGQQQSKLEKMQQVKQELKAATKESSQENELLLLQLHQIQEELEKTFLRKEQLEEQAQKDQVIKQQFQGQIDQLTKALDEQVKLHSQQQAKLENVQQAHQQLEATSKELTWENELLLLQLHQVQEELEKIFLQKQQLEQQMKLVETPKNGENQELELAKEELLKKEKELERLHQRETRLKQTLSWRITAPVRAITKPFKKMTKDEIKIKEQIKLLRASSLFDEAWYVTTNEDVAESGFDPVEHYIRYGAAEGRDPSPVFSSRSYLEINPDVADAGMNPLVHFAQHGMAENRTISS